jgi:adenylylsulfate kinase-like enzyme
VPGLQEPYEPPLHPELVIDTTQQTPEEAAMRVLEALQSRGYLMAERASAR